MPYIIVEGLLGDRGGGSSRKDDENVRPQTPNTSRMGSGSSPRPQFHVSVSGLKAAELSDLRNFSPGVDKDNYTITFPQHPCVILNALEVLGFRVVSSAPKVVLSPPPSTNNSNESTTPSSSIEQSIVWTLRKEFEDIEL